MSELSPFLKEISAFIEARSMDVIRVSESYRGDEIATAEYKAVSPCQDVYSVAKTFTMTALGILYDRGLLRPDEKICDILADELPEAGMDPRWYGSTVDMALRHRLGLPGGFLDIDVNPSSDFTEDFLKYLFTYPLAYAPDTESRYSDGAYYLLARIGEKRAGMPLDSFLWREMLTKLDFQEMAWSHCPRGHVIGATGLYVHASDMVKLGLVYLNGGLYKGKRVLSREWTDLAVSRQYALDWNGDRSAYGKGGMYGQQLLVLPGQHRAVAIQSFCGDIGPLNGWIMQYGDRP